MKWNFDGYIHVSMYIRFFFVHMYKNLCTTAGIISLYSQAGQVFLGS